MDTNYNFFPAGTHHYAVPSHYNMNSNKLRLEYTSDNDIFHAFQVVGQIV